MGAKEDFFAEFVTDLPEGIQEKLSAVIPSLTPTTLPTDVDSAVITQGILAHNLNKILKTCLEGVPLLYVPLMIGQLNTVHQCLLGAALEFVGGSGDLKVIAPLDGSVWHGHFGITTLYTVEVLRGTPTAISCSIGPDDTFDLTEDTEDTGIWSGEWATPLGQHTAVFTATYEDKTTTTETVNFSVGEYPTTPAGDEEYVDAIPLELHAPAEIENAAVDIVDESGDVITSFNLAYDHLQGYFHGIAENMGNHVVIGEDGILFGAIFHFAVVGMEVFQKQVNFWYEESIEVQ